MINENKHNHTDTQYRAELLKVFVAFHNFCEKHNLVYYTIGGSLIGAVRHQGFIPWDNDLDVAMPRADHDRFVNLRSKMTPSIGVAVPYIDKWYKNTKVRVYSKEYAIQENFQQSYGFGPWLDVFPLDNTFSNKLGRYLHFRLVWVLKVLNACKLGGVVTNGGILARVKLILYYLLKPVPYKYLHSLFYKAITLKHGPAKFYGNLMGRWKEKEFIDAAELNKRSLLKFENIQIYSFKNYDLWLRTVYGDYMQLPPADQQKPDHEINIINQHK